jgi:hypothetical protein
LSASLLLLLLKSVAFTSSAGCRTWLSPPPPTAQIQTQRLFVHFQIDDAGYKMTAMNTILNKTFPMIISFG